MLRPLVVSVTVKRVWTLGGERGVYPWRQWRVSMETDKTVTDTTPDATHSFHKAGPEVSAQQAKSKVRESERGMHQQLNKNRFQFLNFTWQILTSCLTETVAESIDLSRTELKYCMCFVALAKKFSKRGRHSGGTVILVKRSFEEVCT